ncbi:MAG: short-chain dehydrogenase [Flavobacteriales bacterium]|nr:short-chain dehydrogenase [Flavobacteriales bacterium]
MKNILNYYLKRWSLAHRYYKITRFYSFLKNTAYQAFFIIVIFVLLLMAVNFLIIDLNLLMYHIIERYSPKIIILCFLISESILGLIPPEIFILWSSKSGSPILFLFALATVSYIGGVVSYFIGVCISMMPDVRRHLEQKIKQHIINLRKWGGLFIVLGAISPIPHSIVSIGAGLINYKFQYYLLWSLFRYLRFVIYYLIILQVL